MIDKLLNFCLRVIELFKSDLQVRIAISILLTGATLLAEPIVTYFFQQFVLSKNGKI